MTKIKNLQEISGYRVTAIDNTIKFEKNGNQVIFKLFSLGYNGDEAQNTAQEIFDKNLVNL